MTTSRFKKIHLLVLDSVGIGEMPDAADFGDVGVNTLGHIAGACGKLAIPNLQKLGIANLTSLKGIEPVEKPLACYGKMREASNGKDTLTGHWEMMGIYVTKPFRVFPEGFPQELIERLENYSGRKVIGNKPASGTEIIQQLGEEHLKTGALIVYTSADSVLQIAAHEEIVPLDELYRICKFCREITLEHPYTLGRIIARPFLGNPGGFSRTSNRHDYCLKPFARTVMNELKDAGYAVIAFGKISDIYAGEGITKSVRITSNMDGMNKFIAVFAEEFTGLSFLNLVDFDALYGHRRDVLGYGRALEEFDSRLPELFAAMTAEDLLIITADHGNDPTYHGSDHTREYVPLLVYSPCFSKGKQLPLRKTFADIGASVAENFKIKTPEFGLSFLRELDVF